MIKRNPIIRPSIQFTILCLVFIKTILTWPGWPKLKARLQASPDSYPGFRIDLTQRAPHTSVSAQLQTSDATSSVVSDEVLENLEPNLSQHDKANTNITSTESSSTTINKEEETLEKGLDSTEKTEEQTEADNPDQIESKLLITTEEKPSTTEEQEEEPLDDNIDKEIEIEMDDEDSEEIESRSEETGNIQEMNIKEEQKEDQDHNNNDDDEEIDETKKTKQWPVIVFGAGGVILAVAGILLVLSERTKREKEHKDVKTDIRNSVTVWKIGN